MIKLLKILDRGNIMNTPDMIIFPGDLPEEQPVLPKRTLQNAGYETVFNTGSAPVKIAVNLAQ